MVGVFELNKAKEYSLAFEVSPQTPRPRSPIGQQRCFCMPMVGVFELHNAKKVLFGFWGGAPNTHTTVTHRIAKVFLDT